MKWEFSCPLRRIGQDFYPYTKIWTNLFKATFYCHVHYILFDVVGTNYRSTRNVHCVYLKSLKEWLNETKKNYLNPKICLKYNWTGNKNISKHIFLNLDFNAKSWASILFWLKKLSVHKFCFGLNSWLKKKCNFKYHLLGLFFF